MKQPNYKRALIELTETITAFEKAMDAVMKQPESNQRGRQIAQLLNALTSAKQSAQHFTLGYSFKKINRPYDKVVK